MVMRLAKLTQESMVSGLSERHLVSGGMKMISNGSAPFVDAHTPAPTTDIAPLVERGWRCSKDDQLATDQKRERTHTESTGTAVWSVHQNDSAL